MQYEFDEQRRAALLELTAELVRRPTENIPPNGYEAAGQEFFSEYLREMGLQIDMFSPEELPEYPSNPEFLPRNLKGRKNVVGIWKGSGKGRSLLLTGHMDVAPKEPMPWTVTQPFTPLARDGKLYGRGTADMKGGLACAAAAVKLLKDEGFSPAGDVLIEAVVDEEYAGANGTIASRLRGYNADFAIDLEPTGLNICPACVGGLLFKLTVKGVAGMPYTGEEIGNPAYDIAEIILLVKEFSDKRILETPRPALWDGTVQGAQIVITKVKAGEAYESGQLSSPIDAWIEIAMQSYPGETADELESMLRNFMAERYHDPEGLSIEREYHYCRPSATDPEHEGVRLLKSCASKYTDRAIVCGAMFSCDMFALTEIGQIPSVVFGPVGGRLHAPDEWVDIESLNQCASALADFIVSWCG